jgi:hypothetical protein
MNNIKFHHIHSKENKYSAAIGYQFDGENLNVAFNLIHKHDRSDASKSVSRSLICNRLRFKRESFFSISAEEYNSIFLMILEYELQSVKELSAYDSRLNDLVCTNNILKDDSVLEGIMETVKQHLNSNTIRYSHNVVMLVITIYLRKKSKENEKMRMLFERLEGK